MKNKIWLLQLPIILVCTGAFWVTLQGEKGQLNNELLRQNIFPALRATAGTFTNLKFKIRGPIEPKNKIVIIEIDSASIEAIGRWPWHRDFIAFLIEKTLQAGAKVVGMDMVFSETDPRVSKDLAKLLESRNLGHLMGQLETDPALTRVIQENADRLVLGWTTESACQPAYSKFEECPVSHPEAIATHPAEMPKFAYSRFSKPKNFDPQKTPVMSIVTFIPNIPPYAQAAKYSGTFSIFPDPDGYIRRTTLAYIANGNAYPSLPLEMARVGLQDELELKMANNLTIQSIQLVKSKIDIPVTPLGIMDINFRGKSYTFNYVSALEVMGDEDAIHVGFNRQIASTKKDLLKDAYVFIGVTALGVHDMRAFPYDSNTPGVEGHANILDNILSQDYLKSTTSGSAAFWMLLIMTIGALSFAVITEKMESIPAVAIFTLGLIGFGLFDQKILFERNHFNLNTSLYYIEMFFIFMLTMSMKYILEEKNKKFVKGAFAKYVAPAVVDSIIKDPTKLTVGGIKKDLTILFSDVRGFTTFSERMDAKHLAGFLNDYLGVMTEIVIQNQGTLDKYIGDAVMAFWGAPIDQKNHAANSCKTAIEMLRALEQHKARFKSQYGVDVEIGVGLNSGPVNVGNMGSERIFAYTVIGDHVNLASRLEGLTKYYGAGIITTRFTFNEIEKSGEPLPPHRTLDFVKVKGKNETVELIQVLEKDYSAEGLKAFEEGRQLYRAQKWDEAIDKFGEANQFLRITADKDDGPSQAYIERCQELKTQPPGPNWDGSWVMTSK